MLTTKVLSLEPCPTQIRWPQNMAVQSRLNMRVQTINRVLIGGANIARNEGG
jgi:hypothetical protein